MVSHLLQFARASVSWALIVLFGPAPLAPLLARPAGQACRMTCCRLRNKHLCSEHDAPATPYFQAGGDCLPDCAHAALAPVMAAAAIAPDNPVHFRREVKLRVFSSAAPGLVCFHDPFLYQRPPPLLLQNRESNRAAC